MHPTHRFRLSQHTAGDEANTSYNSNRAARPGFMRPGAGMGSRARDEHLTRCPPSTRRLRAASDWGRLEKPQPTAARPCPSWLSTRYTVHDRGKQRGLVPVRTRDPFSLASPFRPVEEAISAPRPGPPKACLAGASATRCCVAVCLGEHGGPAVHINRDSWR